MPTLSTYDEHIPKNLRNLIGMLNMKVTKDN